MKNDNYIEVYAEAIQIYSKKGNKLIPNEELNSVSFLYEIALKVNYNNSEIIEESSQRNKRFDKKQFLQSSNTLKYYLSGRVSFISDGYIE